MTNSDSPKLSKGKKRAITGFLAALLFVLAFVVFFRMNFTTVEVSGDSMLPTLKSGKRVLVSNAYWLVGKIARGNIVVIRNEENNEYIIKRVFRLAGENVDSYNAPNSWRLESGPYTVPPDSIYVLGDNRAVSEDSRKFGAVEASKVIGKVVAY